MILWARCSRWVCSNQQIDNSIYGVNVCAPLCLTKWFAISDGSSTLTIYSGPRLMRRVVRSLLLDALSTYKRKRYPAVNMHCAVTKHSSIVSPIFTRGYSICWVTAFFCYFYQLISTISNLCIRFIRKQFMKVFLRTSVAVTRENQATSQLIIEISI